MLEITTTALDKIKQMMEEKGKSDSALRVAIRGRGPQGFLYQLGFVDLENKKPDDTELNIDDRWIEGVSRFRDSSQPNRFNP
jgi:Fe-S cluster assembly iron-binding protein IscA